MTPKGVKKSVAYPALRGVRGFIEPPPGFFYVLIF